MTRPGALPPGRVARTQGEIVDNDYVQALLAERNYRAAQGLIEIVAQIDAELARCGHVVEGAARKPKRKALAEPEV